MLPHTITVAIYAPSRHITQHFEDALAREPTITVLRTFSRARGFPQFMSKNQVDVAMLAVTTLTEFTRVMRQIRQAGKVPECIAIVSDAADETPALARGAVGCIVPLAPVDDCALAVKHANHRWVFLTPPQANDITTLLHTNQITPTVIEGKLLALIAAGISYATIAANDSALSVEIIAGHMYNLLAKLCEPLLAM